MAEILDSIDLTGKKIHVINFIGATKGWSGVLKQACNSLGIKIRFYSKNKYIVKTVPDILLLTAVVETPELINFIKELANKNLVVVVWLAFPHWNIVRNCFLAGASDVAHKYFGVHDMQQELLDSFQNIAIRKNIV